MAFIVEFCDYHLTFAKVSNIISSWNQMSLYVPLN